MTALEDVPTDIQELFIKYNAGTIKEDERQKLYKWILDKKKEDKTFELRTFVRENFAYDEIVFRRLEKAIQRFGKATEVTATRKLKELEAGDFADFIETMWNNAKGIATSVVIGWTERAKEYGYYDKESGEIRMKDFIEDACNFFIDYRDQIDALQDQLRDSEAALSLFAEMAKPNIIRIASLRTYTTFVTKTLELAARGIPVPESIIQDVKETVNQVIFTATLPKEALETYGQR